MQCNLSTYLIQNYNKQYSGLLDLYQKEKEKNKELELELMEKDLHIYGLKENRRLAAEEIQEQYFISKDKIKVALGIEEDVTEEQILNYIDILVSENARLEDIEDKKVQIEYQNVFNKGVKSVEDKIKAKVEEYKARGYEEAIGALQELLEEDE